MPRKGMRSICFVSKTPSFAVGRDSSPSEASISTPRRNFSESMVEQSIEAASAIIMKWNPDTSTFAKVTSLFYHSKPEAMKFLRCVNDLQKAMHLLLPADPSSIRIVHAQNLMQIAMKRLQKEFYQILSMNRAHLDPESVSARSSRTSARSSTSDFEIFDASPDRDVDDALAARDSISQVEEVSSIAISDLRSIADCMISSGYAKECVSIYNIIRKSIVDEGIYRLGVEKMSSSRVNKMEWEVLDVRTKSWLEAVKVSMKTLFTGERILCDDVFGSSDSIRESCFAEISKEGATLLFGFPELVVKSKNSPPEKIFRVLDMYTAIAENWQVIESIFSFESTNIVRSLALNSLIRLGDSVRLMLADFESSIQKDSSKLVIPGGGLHPLTIDSVNYLSLLADYSNILTDILADWPPPEKSTLPDFYFNSPVSDDSSAPMITLHMAWLIVVLLCKLDSKAKHYKDVSTSYLFLANNLQHLVRRVRASNLQYLLGEEWIRKHEAKLKQFTASYERLAWGPVLESLPVPEKETAAMTQEEAKECFNRFNERFEEAYQKQRSCIVSDTNLRDEIKVSIAGKLVPAYREFYSTHSLMIRTREREDRNIGWFVRFTPEDVGNYLSDLFFGMTNSENSSTTSSSSSSFWRHLLSPLRN